MIKIKTVLERYGLPGDIKNQTSIKLPYPMRIAWDLSKSINIITCHKLIARPLVKTFTEILAEYGMAKVKSYRLDVYGGCFNHRPMRGTETRYAKAIAAGNYHLASTYLSKHSWAIAIDLDPERNGLKMKANKASFARPEYRPMIEIFYANGFVNQGVELGFDWMHFEVAK